jgi:DNA polymerase III subunit beta
MYYGAISLLHFSTFPDTLLQQLIIDMKVTIPLDKFKKQLAFINHAVSARSQLPILTNILLEVKADALLLSSTDLEIGILTEMAVVAEEVGSTTVPARTFTELIQSLSDDTITMKLEGSTLEVTSKKTKSLFQTIAASEFPKLFEEKGQEIATLDMKNLSHELGAILFSASTETTRPALAGILVKREEKGFLLVATDGYRLSLKHYTGGVSTKDGGVPDSLIVPARVFREVLGMKEDSESVSVFLEKDANQIIFEGNGATLVGRLIESEFPNFEKIIPTDHTTETAFSREELHKAVKICSIFARDSANIIKLSLKPTKIIVSSQTPSLGENTVEVDAVLTGEENDIAFNARYLLDALSNLPGDDLNFQMTGPLNPGVFKLKEDNSYLHLIMPIRIQQ